MRLAGRCPFDGDVMHDTAPAHWTWENANRSGSPAVNDFSLQHVVLRCNTSCCVGARCAALQRVVLRCQDEAGNPIYPPVVIFGNKTDTPTYRASWATKFAQAWLVPP